MSKNQPDVEAGILKVNQRNNRLSWNEILLRWGTGLAIFLVAMIGGLVLIAFWKKSSNKISENSRTLASRDEISSFAPGLVQTENLITPITDEFVVNDYATNAQSGSAASALINSTGIVVWNSAYQDLKTSNSIYARQINDRGDKLRAEFQVSPDNNNVQHKPSVTQLLNGEYVVVWIDETDKYIYGQRFNITNIKIGLVFQINSNALYDVYVPIVKVKRFSNGGFLVIWNNHVNAAGENDDIYGQYYAADGSPIGSNVKMNTLTAGNQSYPDVTVLADDKQIVTWDSSTLGGIGYQAFNANRTVLGSEMNVLYASDQYQWYPAITTLIDDASVLVWNCQQAQQYVVKICAQLLTSTGQKNGSPFVANNNLLVSVAWPTVVGLDNGNFVIVWAGYSYGSLSECVGKLEKKT